MQTYLSAPQIAKEWGVSETRVRQVLGEGKLLGTKDERGNWTVAPAEWAAFLELNGPDVLTIADLSREIATLAGRSLRTVQACVTGLRARGLLPHVAPGSDGPPATPAHAATILIALSVGDAAAGLSLGPIGPHEWPDATAFADTLTAILNDDALARRVSQVVIGRSAPEAEIYFRRTATGKLLMQNYRAVDAPAPRTTAMRTSDTLPRALLQQIALALVNAREGRGALIPE